MARKFKGNYPGVPAEVSPAEAEMLKEHHPNYEAVREVVEERLAEYKTKHAPPKPTAPAAPAAQANQEVEKKEEPKNAVS